MIQDFHLQFNYLQREMSKVKTNPNKISRILHLISSTMLFLSLFSINYPLRIAKCKFIYLLISWEGMNILISKTKISSKLQLVLNVFSLQQNQILLYKVKQNNKLKILAILITSSTCLKILKV